MKKIIISIIAVILIITVAVTLFIYFNNQSKPVYNIALITNNFTLEIGGKESNINTVIKNICTQKNTKAKQFVTFQTDDASKISNINSAIIDNYNLLVTAEEEYFQIFIELSSKYPNVKFIIFSDYALESNSDNLFVFTNTEYEADIIAVINK